MWHLFSQQPIILDHPSGGHFIAAAVSRNRHGNLGWWNADYIINQNSTGFGGSGFAFNPIYGQQKWNGGGNCWEVFDDSEPDLIYIFRLPSDQILREWERWRQFVPSIDALQKMAELE